MNRFHKYRVIIHVHAEQLFLREKLRRQFLPARTIVKAV
jgi:hypothetical protein